MIDMRVNETASAMLSRAWQKDVLRGLRDTMDFQNQLTIGHTRRTRLSGKGPFPVSQGRLGVRTNRLRGSARATVGSPEGIWNDQARIVGTTVVSSMGSNVEYAAAHEFGATIHRTVRPGSVRLRTNAKGDLLLGATGGAVFAKGKHKRAREVAYAGGKSYTINIPARAPITHGIEDRKAAYERAMSASIIATLRGLGYS